MCAGASADVCAVVRRISAGEGKPAGCRRGVIASCDMMVCAGRGPCDVMGSGGRTHGVPDDGHHRCGWESTSHVWCAGGGLRGSERGGGGNCARLSKRGSPACDSARQVPACVRRRAMQFDRKRGQIFCVQPMRRLLRPRKHSGEQNGALEAKRSWYNAQEKRQPTWRRRRAMPFDRKLGQVVHFPQPTSHTH